VQKRQAGYKPVLSSINVAAGGLPLRLSFLQLWDAIAGTLPYMAPEQLNATLFQARKKGLNVVQCELS